MNDFIGKKVLITTQGWFYGKDGKQYRAIHGTLKAVHESAKTLGFIPNRAHANWYFEIGDMVIMGCQVLYVQQADEVNTGNVWETLDNGDLQQRPTQIYLTT